MKRVSHLLALLAVTTLLSARCLAQVDPWEFEVYQYATTPRGIAELESSNSVVTSGHGDPGAGTSNGSFASDKLWYNAYEFTYGLTDRIEAAGYVTFAQPNGRPFQWSGNKFRLRGRLFDEDVLPVNVGWYAEVETHQTPQFDDAQTELELRPIVEKDFGPIAVMLNPKFEKVLAGEGRHNGFEFGYAAGIQYRYSRRLSPGLEFYGGCGLIRQIEPLHEQQHYVFPALWGELPGGIEYNVGLGYGLTPNSDHVIFKINLEVERFVGSLFKASPAKAWFY